MKKQTTSTGETRRLNVKEAEEVRVLERLVAEKERELGRIALNLLAAEAQRTECARQLQQRTAQRDGRIAEIARAHGIDPMNASRGKWRFDPTAEEPAFHLSSQS
jgi:hypothetical protein